MEIDNSDQYLATGDVNGVVKVWYIGDYCMNICENTPLITNKRIIISKIKFKNLFYSIFIFI
jgi:hypothetical protein